jgi:thiol-disulfide isomerase/thioredoxin
MLVARRTARDVTLLRVRRHETWDGGSAAHGVCPRARYTRIKAAPPAKGHFLWLEPWLGACATVTGRLSPREENGPGGDRPRRALAAATAALLLAGLGAGCGAKQPPSAARPAEYRSALRGAPPPISRLYSRPNAIVNGGPAAFKAQLASLRGYPVVVNKWASWCGPCRYEFPFFQALVRRYGRRIAFLAVDSMDARSDAQRFLRKFPVPYPSFFDSNGAIARVFRGDRVSPSTAFYDAKGALVLTKQGGYASRAALEKDIRQYAR